MHRVVQATLALIGLNHLVVTLLTFVAPMWFFNNVGYFPPFNAHYLADIGAYNLPLGVGLLIAVSDPVRHRVLIGLAASGNLAHAFSHLRDFHLHLPPHMPVVVGVTQQLSILAMGLILLAIVGYLPTIRPVRSRQSRQGAR